MTRKGGLLHLSDLDEQHATEELRSQTTELNEPSPMVPQAYWTNLLVKTNRRIDEATSAKALSISWAARVAIPGVVAILFFFIGLHYYGPETGRKEGSVASLVNTLPQETLDSILAEPGRLSTSLSAAEVSSDIFQFSMEQISDYLVATGSAQTVVENLDDSEMRVLLSALDNQKNM